ncbi:MAG: lipoprotein-releasing ABC transporter permease subunit [Azospirillaceae bacterium]|nr:lipoprotein-releasing ABC transporter permease subunit [Azospirillaceae bacterium]
MFGAFERMVAFRYLRARRQEGFISVIAGFSLLGIALGVATLIIVMSVMNGFRTELLGRVLGLNGHFNVYAGPRPLTGFEALAAQIARVDGVVSVTPMVEAQALLTVRGNASGVIVRGVSQEDMRHLPAVSDHIIAGSIDDFSDGRVAIGVRMAQRLGLAVGDELTLIAPQGNVTAFGTVPRMRAYPVGAIFDVGMYEYDNNFVFMPLDAAQLFFRMPQAVSSLEVMVRDPNNLAAARSAIQQAVGDGYRLIDWQMSNSSFFTAIQVERNVMFLILTLIIVVAAFNIISSLIMLVKDKGRDIAILRTMGATRGMIMRIFFISGASIGVIGTLAGLGLGVAFAENIETIRQWIQGLTGTNLFNAEIYFLSHLPAQIDWHEVAQVVGMALALSFGATIYPAWRAAALDPVEALRNE